MKLYVGLDVHSKSTTYAIQNEHGTMVAEGEFPTTAAGIREFVRECELPKGTHVGLESGTVSFFVARMLALGDVHPVVVDAREVRLKAHRPNQKSDSRDAREICHGLRTGMYRSIVHVPDRPVSMLRDVLKRRRHFVRLAASQITAAKSLMRAAGLGASAVRFKTSKGWERCLAELEDVPELRTFLDQHRIMWRAATAQIKKLDVRLESLARPFANDLQRLQQVPGVGPVVAMTVVAMLSDPHRFATAKHVSSYAGLVPAMYQSGTTARHGHITKRGNTELRSMLVEAAHHARRPHHPLNPFFSRLCAQKGYKVAAVAVAHRLVRILWAMLRTGADFDPTMCGVEEGPFTTARTRKYRLLSASN